MSLARRQISRLDERARKLPENRDVSHFMQNPGQGLSVRFGRGRVAVEDWKTAHRQVTFGYAGASPSSRLEAAGTRASYAHQDGVVEWFENGKDGLMHGFELVAREPGSERRELRVAMDGMQARTAANGKDLEWVLPDGEPALAYAGLKAWDAAGMDLPATMAPCSGGFRILVDDRNARYPVHIDPLLTRMTAKLGVPVNTGDGEAVDEFGRSVATDGTRLLVGARGDNGFSGSAYVFQRSGGEWYFEAKLVAPGGISGEWFGESVAIDGNLAVIGAEGAFGPGLTDMGAAYVFERANGVWTFRQKLAPANGWLGDYFGASVAIQGERLLIGASAANTFTPHTGSPGYACLYERTGGAWIEQARLVDPQGLGNDNFGNSVALEGDRAFVGKPTNGTGQVLVFRQDGATWTLEARLAGKFAGDRFGHSLGVDGDLLAVGVQQADTTAGISAGNVEVFRRSGTAWAPEATLKASDGGEGQWFGSSVAVDGSTILVGATYSYYESGSAYAFQKSGANWTQAAHLYSPFGTYDGRAGFSVALKGDLAFVGAYASDTQAGSYAGMVHHYIRTGSSWSGYRLLSAGDGEAGQQFGSRLDLDGERLAVGMPQDSTPYGPGCGTVYLFARDGEGWIYEQAVNDPTPVKLENFGLSLDLDGGLLAVGTPSDVKRSTNPSDVTLYRYGSVSCFRRDAAEWVFEAKLRPAASHQDDRFGWALALKNGDLLVGAPWANTGSVYRTGAGHVFRRSGTTWSEEARLVPPGNGSISGSMGSAVALQDNRALLGDPWYYDPVNHFPGGVREFVKSGATWSDAGVIVPQSRAGNAVFGTMLALDGDLLLAASQAPQFDGTESSAYLMRRNGSTWTQEAILQSPDAEAVPYDRFGTVVALHDGTAVVGAPNDSIAAGTATGSVHVFRSVAGSWQRVQKITAPDQGFDGLGGSLAIYGNLLVAGAPQDDEVNDMTGDLTEDRGSVYFFVLGEGYRSLEVRDENDGVMVTGSAATAFGTATINLLSTRHDFTVFNRGTLPLEGLALGLGGANGVDFRVSPAVPSILAAGEGVTFTVWFEPRTAGDKSAWLDVSTNDPDSPVVRLDFTGYANRKPVSHGRSFVCVAGKPVTLFLEDLAYDPDGDSYSIMPRGGLIDIGGGMMNDDEHSLFFHPDPGFTGDEVVSSIVIDEHGASMTVIATITVLPATSFPGLGAPVFPTGAEAWGVTLHGTPGHVYRVERSSDLRTWELLGITTPAGSGEFFFIDYGRTESTGFYRLAE